MNDDTGLEMTWTPEQLGCFIDQVNDDRFLAMWLLVTTSGLRLDTIAGLQRNEVDLHHRRIFPRTRPVAVGDPSRPPKFSREGYMLDPDAYDVLKDHVIAWDKEREEFLHYARNLFLWSDGTPLHTNAVSSMFHQHCANADLPAVPLHEVRQAYVVAALQTGIPTAILCERLGDQIDSPTLGLGSDKRTRHGATASRGRDRRQSSGTRSTDDAPPRQSRQRHLRSL